MRECGRAPVCICNVLAVIGDGEESIRATLAAAVELAEVANARLTLVKACEQGGTYVWIAPFAVGAAYMPPPLESPEDASRLLARVAEDVPASIPLTTLVLTADPQTSLLRLLRAGNFGAIVADGDLLSHWWRLRRHLRHEQLRTVLIRGGRASAGDQAVRGSRTTRSADVSTSASATRSRSRSTGSSSYLSRVRPKPAR